MSLLGFLVPKERKKRAVWSKGYIIPGYDPREFRMDENRQIIRYDDFANPASPYAWEYAQEPMARCHHHIDDPANLRPLNLNDVANLAEEVRQSGAAFALRPST